MEEAKDMRKEFFLEIRNEIDQEMPDIDKVTALLKKGLHELPDHMEKNLDLVTEFYNILDDEQKARVIDEVKSKMKYCRFGRFSEE